MLRRLAIPFVMIVMAVVTTWPLAIRLDRGIPQGAETSPTVPVFNLWTVGWNLDRFWCGWQNFWDAPHFAPTEQTLALSEPLIASQALAGLAWLSPPVAYNLFLLSAIALNAGVTWLALRHRRVPWPVALLVSLAMARLPFVHWQLGLLQCVLVAGLIGVIHFGEEAFTTGRLSRLWLAAGCFDVTFLACGYYGVFLVLLLPAWGVVLAWQCVRGLSAASARRASEGSDVFNTNIWRWHWFSCGSAPTGQPHASPGQRPGSGLSKDSEALKGRHPPLDQSGCAPSGLSRWWRSQTPVGRLPWADLWLPRWGGTASGDLKSGGATQAIVGVALGVLLILAAIVPVVMVQSRVLSDPHFARTREVIQELSARPTDYLATPFPEWLQFVGLSRWHEAGRWKLSPGLLKVTLGLLGLVVGLRSRSRRSWTLTWLAISVAAFVGSLGLNFQIAGWRPYGTLLDWIPTLARLRTPARMSVLVQIGVVFLAAEALLWGYRRARIVARNPKVRSVIDSSGIGNWKLEIGNWKFIEITRSVRRIFQSPISNPQFSMKCVASTRLADKDSVAWSPGTGVRTKLVAFGLFWLIGIAACCEVPLRRLKFVDVPSVETQKGWIDWLKNNTSPETVIAHVPFPKGPLPRDYEAESWAMYWGLFHQRRMVNGFSGFFPASYLELKAQMQSFPDDASFAALRSRGVSICVVKESFLEAHPLPDQSESPGPWERVFQDREAGVVLFRLRR